MSKPKDPDVLEALETNLPGGDDAPDRKDPAPEPGADEAAQDASRAASADPVARRAPAEEPLGAADDAALDDPEEPPVEHGHRSLAATTLLMLVGAIAVAGVTLWGAPKIAPHVPAGIGKYLVPGQVAFEARLAEIDARVADAVARSEAAATAAAQQSAALAERLDAAESARADAAGAAAEATAAATAAAESAAGEAAAATARLATVEGDLAALRSELTAISDALAKSASGRGAAATEVSAAMAAMSARLDKLAAAVDAVGDTEALDARIAALAERLEAVESSAAASRTAQNAALGEVSSAIHQASLRAAVTSLTSRLAGGSPYAAPLDEIAALTGSAPPPELAAGAERGFATAASLGAAFPPHAQAAIAADVRARAGDDVSSQVLGWLQAQVTGRPTSEQPGDSIGAVTSRIAARVEEGALPKALAEADSLPPHAQAALGGWLDELRARVAANAALDAWLAEIGAGG